MVFFFLRMSFCHASDSVRFTGRVGEKGILFGVAETTKVRKKLWLRCFGISWIFGGAPLNAVSWIFSSRRRFLDFQ